MTKRYWIIEVQDEPPYPISYFEGDADYAAMGLRCFEAQKQPGMRPLRLHEISRQEFRRLERTEPTDAITVFEVMGLDDEKKT